MSDATMNEKVAEVVEQIRPALQADGGDIELVGVTDDNVVQVRLRGACAGCPGARMTLQMVVQARLQEAIPEIKGIEQVE